MKVFLLAKFLLGVHLTLTRSASAGIAECSSFGQCSQVCLTESPGCSCIGGFELGDDDISCIPEDPNWKLLFVGRGEIGYISGNDTGEDNRKVFYPNGIYSGFNSVGVSYDYRSQLVYWSDGKVGSESIYRASIQGQTVPEALVNTGIGYPEGIAFDWITGNVYFVDLRKTQITVCRNDSVNVCAVVMKDNVPNSPREVCLEPNLSLMFWTDWGASPAILRAGMDGSQKSRIVTGNLKWPNGITVDMGNSRIYWVDAHFGVIESANFHGSDRTTVLKKQVGDIRHFFGVDVFGDRIFWSQWLRDGIESADKFTGENISIHWSHPSSRINSVAVFHLGNQPITRTNPCQDNSHCSHICVLSQSSAKFTCLCPVGMIATGTGVCDQPLLCNTTSCEPSLSGDFLNLQDNSDLVVISFQNSLAITSANSTRTSNTFKRVQLPEIHQILGMAYNPWSDTIIMTDSKKIYEYNLKSENVTVLLEEDLLGSVQGIEVDDVGGNLYWISRKKNRVEMLSLRSMVRMVVMENMEDLCAILIAPEQESLFLARASLKGGVEINNYFISDSRLKSSYYRRGPMGCPTTLAWDRSGNILFSVNGESTIEAIRVLENGRMQEATAIIPVAGVASGISKFGDRIFWVDSSAGLMKQVDVPFKSHGGISSIHFLTNDERSRFLQSRRLFSPKVTVINRVVRSGAGKLCYRKECEHICLATKQCVCSPGFGLKNDGKSCEMYSKDGPPAQAKSNHGSAPTVNVNKPGPVVIPVTVSEKQEAMIASPRSENNEIQNAGQKIYFKTHWLTISLAILLPLCFHFVIL